MNYLIFKKNIKMLPSKVALEVTRLSQQEKLKQRDKIIVVGVSSWKFDSIVEVYGDNARLRTDPDSGIVTCACLRIEGGLRVKL